MEWIQCDEGRLDELSDFYDRVVTYLEAHINYPKWSHAYPCRKSVEAAIHRGDQYACLEDGRIVGAAVMNDNPGGAYEKGDWSCDLQEGEYLILHSLAADPERQGCGIGDFMVKCALSLQKQMGIRRSGWTWFRGIHRRRGCTDTMDSRMPAQEILSAEWNTFRSLSCMRRI